ncbi:4-carboxy-4-hydroxy-2-oxoadipate aldolase/oxaloacetate decarboxylase [Phytohabitans sp. ZYX-F-186]|uniref:Putative 4-hydroxy-4-methyl-2-oxoglutarate aldolase n=1 Tax=Phytohabitans maris TaxID=3071409 RepID=A0ABU0ZFA1_9ACTN|nr:4-carboxy-4-hydroxy-2-oxoadipate aldolase/oxaloacetate decarboxylase [Phytohabitans sp. ZYX-F-186]MDQ7904627.1 4-carboxy-4-hydroxy-2-oxoadipate aldolase/oxaloacetate decarboxylase [Phytohabitans sp. ZYX-F-186]
MTRIHARAASAPAEVVADLARFGVATVHEAYDRRGLMTGLTPLDPELTACGPAVTALCHAGDNLMVHAAIDTCTPGDILVVATLSPSTHGMFGDLLATLCQARGVAALVIDAGVRDTRDIRRAGFPVWSRAISAAGTTKQAAGWVNTPVVCGGVQVTPGDLVLADADGVVVVATSDAAEVAAAAARREEHEGAVRARYAAGHGKNIDDLLRQAGAAGLS